MNYQKIVCWGDSQTFGARTYGCYPLYLVRDLNASTRYVWSATNFSTNGHTARELWFRVSEELGHISDVHQACILIGANDVGRRTQIDLFEEYLRQTLTALQLHGMKAVHCGEIPPIWPDGHAFFNADTPLDREKYNARVRKVVEQHTNARLVPFSLLTPSCYVDPVHFNEQGNEIVAAAFAESIKSL